MKILIALTKIMFASVFVLNGVNEVNILLDITNPVTFFKTVCLFLAFFNY